MWRRQFAACVNVAGHLVHLKGFSPLCVRMWSLMWVLWWVVYGQRLQTNKLFGVFFSQGVGPPSTEALPKTCWNLRGLFPSASIAPSRLSLAAHNPRNDLLLGRMPCPDSTAERKKCPCYIERTKLSGRVNMAIQILYAQEATFLRHTTETSCKKGESMLMPSKCYQLDPLSARPLFL